MPANYLQLAIDPETGRLELHIGNGQRVSFRQDTAEAWMASTALIHLNEPVFCTTSRLLKLGDGVRSFPDLPILADL